MTRKLLNFFRHVFTFIKNLRKLFIVYNVDDLNKNAAKPNREISFYKFTEYIKKFNSYLRYGSIKNSVNEICSVKIYDKHCTGNFTMEPYRDEYIRILYLH